MVMQSYEITEIEREIEKIKNQIEEARALLRRLENQKLNLEGRLIATHNRIQKSGIKY